jgi:hypothetical protein
MRIVQLMTDQSRYFNPSKNYWFSFNEFTGEVESRVYNSEGTLVRYNGKHLADNNSQYQIHDHQWWL